MLLQPQTISPATSWVGRGGIVTLELGLSSVGSDGSCGVVTGVRGAALEVILKVVASVEAARTQGTLEGQHAGVEAQVSPVIVFALDDLSAHLAPEARREGASAGVAGKQRALGVREWRRQTKHLVDHTLDNLFLITTPIAPTTSTTPLQQKK